MPLPEQTEYLSKEQFYKMCHISKATALQLIQTRTVPAVDTGKRTNRYLIARSDVEKYLQVRSENPPSLTSGRAKSIYTYGVLAEYNQETAARLRRIATYDWRYQPDILLVSDISSLLGYRKETIYRWRKKLGLKSCIISSKLYIPKQYLLDFIESPEFYHIQKKTIQHINLLRRAIHAGE